MILRLLPQVCLPTKLPARQTICPPAGPPACRLCNQLRCPASAETIPSFSSSFQNYVAATGEQEAEYKELVAADAVAAEAIRQRTARLRQLQETLAQVRCSCGIYGRHCSPSGNKVSRVMHTLQVLMPVGHGDSQIACNMLANVQPTLHLPAWPSASATNYPIANCPSTLLALLDSGAAVS